MNAFADGLRRVFIEITNRCNFDCMFCPSGISERPREDMPRELAGSLLTQLNAMGFAGTLYLHVLGEPLLHPDVFAITDQAADLGMRPVIFTNGGALSEDCVRKILASKARELVISMQTINRESYERLRKTPFDWDTYLGRIQAALAEAGEADSGCVFRVSMGLKKADAQHPDDLYFLEYESLDHVKAGIAAIFSRVKGLDIAHALEQVEAGDVPDLSQVKMNERLRLSVKEIGNWRKTRDREPATTGRCVFFGKECAILADGSVTLCHIDYDGRTTIGNAMEASLEAIFNASEFVDVAKGFAGGDTVPGGCRHCKGVKSV